MIKMSSNIQDLVGCGEEWLLSQDGNQVVAKFIDGNLEKGTYPTNVGERTLTYAELADWSEIQAQELS